MAPPVYASSIAVYEELEEVDAGRTPRADSGVPGTLYGVYKRANEGSAAIFWRDRNLSSVGLRPHTVYGPGRDQGVTSAPTVAMLAAASGTRFRIPYGGQLQFQYVPDVAHAFLAASRARASGATVHNLSGPVVHMREIVAAINAAVPGPPDQITYDEARLPFPEKVDSSSLSKLVHPLPNTPLAEGVGDTIAMFHRLLDDGRISPLSEEGAVAPASTARPKE
jgi:nucleoside-diphosphate-sugar epimerase